MASELNEIRKGRVYRTLVNQGLLVRVHDIYDENGTQMVLVEVTRAGDVAMLSSEPYDKLLQQMQTWHMFELPVITPDPTH